MLTSTVTRRYLKQTSWALLIPVAISCSFFEDSSTSKSNTDSNNKQSRNACSNLNNGPSALNVYLAQTHVNKPNDPCITLVSNRTTLVKVNVLATDKQPNPSVSVRLSLDGKTQEIKLNTPNTIPRSFNAELGKVTHTFEDSFTGYLPKDWIKPSLRMNVLVDNDSKAQYDLTIMAPNKLILTMIDLAFFKDTKEDYPSGWDRELEQKLPISSLVLRRTPNTTVFKQIVTPPNGKRKALRMSSYDDYKKQTGERFNKHNNTATLWKVALREAAGRKRFPNMSLFYINSINIPSKGVAGGFSGVGSPRSIGIFAHELGHALSLPHWGTVNKRAQRKGKPKPYPYSGNMFGIQAPAIYQAVHAGPTWAFDRVKARFISPVSSKDVGQIKPGQYKPDPMQGGGLAREEDDFYMRHFSDFSVQRMSAYMQNVILVWDDVKQGYFVWDKDKNSYSRAVTNNGVNHPTRRDLDVISVMASVDVSSKNTAANIAYPPIGAYRSSMIDLFEPGSNTDPEGVYCPKNGCDYSIRVKQGSTTKTFMLPISEDTSIDIKKINSLATKAINLPASDGSISKIELLKTPNAQIQGIPSNPTVLDTWNQ